MRSLNKREEKEQIKMQEKKKANQMLSFIDEDQEDGENLLLPDSKPVVPIKASGKVSLFGKKIQKITEEDKDSDYVQKRKIKGFGKDPEVNTSFLPDENKDVEDEIK